MENNNTNIDYHKFVRVGDQKWEIVEITIRIICFCLRFVFTIFYTWSFQVPLEKDHPTLNANSHPKLQFDLSPSYISILKNGSDPPHHPGVVVQTMGS